MSRRKLFASVKTAAAESYRFFVPGPQQPWEEESPEGALYESGEELIQSILGAIALRRPVLVTGPRGSGKTFCAEEAIRRAEDMGIIGGNFFRLGNREDARSDFQEDTTVIEEGPNGSPVLKMVDALLVRRPRTPEGMRAYRANNDELLRKRGIKDTRHFPGVTQAPKAGKFEPWVSRDWSVLFLDEINRFGDGVLDSFLSLTEERRIIRGGEELYVPVVVVATANPPGYDATAKKLSPPLQARMSRMFRISQPTLETLALSILPEQIERSGDNLAAYVQTTSTTSAGAGTAGQRRIDVDVDLRERKLVAASCLCLWGKPKRTRKGIGFLTPATRTLLERLAEADPVLSAHMERLSELTSFGPDARSVGDWVGMAMESAVARARRTGSDRTKVMIEDLRGPAVYVTIAGKPRDNFNEGTEPAKAAERESLVFKIITRVLTQASLASIIDVPFERAAANLLNLPVAAVELSRRQLTRIAQGTPLRGHDHDAGAFSGWLDSLRLALKGTADDDPSAGKLTAAVLSVHELGVTAARILSRRLPSAALAALAKRAGRRPDEPSPDGLRSAPLAWEDWGLDGSRALAEIHWELEQGEERLARELLAKGNPSAAEVVRPLRSGLGDFLQVMDSLEARCRAVLDRHRTHRRLAPWVDCLMTGVHGEERASGRVLRCWLAGITAAAEAGAEGSPAAPSDDPLSGLFPFVGDLLDHRDTRKILDGVLSDADRAGDNPFLTDTRERIRDALGVIPRLSEDQRTRLTELLRSSAGSILFETRPALRARMRQAFAAAWAVLVSASR